MLQVGRRCPGPGSPFSPGGPAALWGPLPQLSQRRGLRLLARNGFNVGMLIFAHSTETTMRMQDRKNRAPSSQVLQEVIRQAPAEYVTLGWLTSTLRRHSFGIIMLCLGLLATTPVGSSVPGFFLAIMAVQLIVGRTEPVFPAFHHDVSLADYAATAAWLPRYLCFEVSRESRSSTLAYDI